MVGFSWGVLDDDWGPDAGVPAGVVFDFALLELRDTPGGGGGGGPCPAIAAAS